MSRSAPVITFLLRWALPIVLSLGCIGSNAVAGDHDDVAGVRRADQERIAATIAGDIAQLQGLLSDELRYTDATDRVQTKREFLAHVAANRTRYLSVKPRAVTVQSVAPGAVVMEGRTQIIAADADGHRMTFGLRFLAVWRNEAGHWRLLAYQSAPLTAPDSVGSK